MIFRIRIQLTHDLLGGGERVDRTRRIIRNADGTMHLHEQDFVRGFCEIARLLGLTIRPDEVLVPLGIDISKATTSLITREFSATRHEQFEGLRRNQRLEFELMLGEGNNHLGAAEVSAVMEQYGRFRGISQFGAKFQCGRFNVLSVVPVSFPPAREPSEVPKDPDDG